tara:strand:+ start:490 stop:783 length:294 start_codon:yes stop_codon:yes gene_type:complete
MKSENNVFPYNPKIDAKDPIGSCSPGDQMNIKSNDNMNAQQKIIDFIEGKRNTFLGGSKLNNYNYIKDPFSNKFYFIHSKNGKNLLKKYINLLFNII